MSNSGNQSTALSADQELQLANAAFSADVCIYVQSL